MLGNPIWGAIERLGSLASVDPIQVDVAEISRSLKSLEKPIRKHDHLSGFDQWIIDFVSNPHTQAVDRRNVANLHLNLMRMIAVSEDQIFAKFRAAIGYFLFCQYANIAFGFDQIQSAPTEETEPSLAQRMCADANTLLKIREIREFIDVLYDLDQSKIGPRDKGVTLIATGTTSYILHVEGGYEVVLKLIKPYFFENPVISQETENFQERNRTIGLGSVNNLTVFESAPRYISMEYIRGKSLDRALRNGDVENLNIKERLEIIYHIIGSLEILSSPHLDLSPSNIMVTPQAVTADGIQRFTIRLIDFGRNYLINQDIAGIPVRNDVVKYIAPELLQNNSSGDTRSDLFSIGMIFIDLLENRDFRGDVSVAVDACWMRYPQFARIIQELISPDPSERTLRGPQPKLVRNSAYYESLREQLKEEEALMQLGASTGGFISRSTGGWLGPVREFGKGMGQLVRMYLRTGPRGTASSTASYLKLWAVFINLFLSVCFLVSGGLALSSLGLDPLLNPDTNMIDVVAKARKSIESILNNFRENDVMQTAIAGRVMATVVVLIIFQYYNQIFSTITMKNLKSKEGRWAEVTMRGTPFIIGSLCLSTAVWFPGYWYFTSLLGPLATALNNWLVLRVCQQSIALHERHLGSRLNTSDMKRFIENFSRWPRGMIWSGGGIFCLGLFVDRTGLANEAFLGLLLALLCFVFLYLGASTHEAVLIRAGIRRCIAASEKVQ